MNSSVRPIESLLVNGLNAPKAEVNYSVVQTEHNLGAKCPSLLHFGAIILRQLTDHWLLAIFLSAVSFQKTPIRSRPCFLVSLYAFLLV